MTSTHHALCELALVNINDDEHLSTADDQEEFDAVQVRAGQIENKITDLRRKYEEHKDHISSMEASGKNIKFAQVQRIKKTAERSLTIKFDTRGLLKDIKNLQMNIKVCKANQEKDGANKRLLESQNRAREATEGRERAEKRLKVSQDSIREANQQKLRAIQQLRELENAARKLKVCNIQHEFQRLGTNEYTNREMLQSSCQAENALPVMMFSSTQ